MNELDPFKFAHDECQCCLHPFSLQAMSQSLPLDDLPQGQALLLMFFLTRFGEPGLEMLRRLVGDGVPLVLADGELLIFSFWRFLGLCRTAPGFCVREVLLELIEDEGSGVLGLPGELSRLTNTQPEKKKSRNPYRELVATRQ